MNDTTLRTLAIAALLLLPLAAHADNDDSKYCKVSEPRTLQLDFRGIDTVVFDIGSNDVDVKASASASGKVDGRAWRPTTKRCSNSPSPSRPQARS